MTVRWIVLGLSIAVAGLSNASAAAFFDTAQSAYEQGLRTNAAATAEAIRLLGPQYRKDLHKMEANARDTRKLDLVRAIRSEIEHYILNAYVPDGENEETLQPVRDLQKMFHKSQMSMLDEKDRGVLRLARRYDTILAGLEREHLAQSEIAAAQAIRSERERLRRRAEVLTARRSLGKGLARLARLRRKPPVREVKTPASPETKGVPTLPRVTVIPPPRVAPDPPDPVAQDNVIVRSQDDGRSRSKYYVGRWVWLPDRLWQREILVFNGAPRPAEDHRVWNYVRRLPPPGHDGRRPWDNSMYKKFSL